MEVKINKEIRDYSESIFFGLGLRQIICFGVAIALSVVIYLTCKSTLGTEITSWICIIVAIPFGALGIVNYHGMKAEKFVIVLLKSFFMPEKLTYHSTNIYYEATRKLTKKEKEQLKINENAKKTIKTK